MREKVDTFYFTSLWEKRKFTSANNKIFLNEMSKNPPKFKSVQTDKKN